MKNAVYLGGPHSSNVEQVLWAGQISSTLLWALGVSSGS